MKHGRNLYNFADQGLTNEQQMQMMRVPKYDKNTPITREALNDIPLTDIHLHLPSTISPETAWELGVRNSLITIEDSLDSRDLNGAPYGKKWINGPKSMGVDSPYEHYSDIFRSNSRDRDEIILDSSGKPINIEYSIDHESFKSFDRVLATIQGHRHPPGGIQTEDDLILVMQRYLEKCIEQKVIYSELQQNIRIAYSIYPSLPQKDARMRLYNLFAEQIRIFREHGIHIRFLHCFNKTQIANTNNTGHDRSLEAYEWLLEAHMSFPDVFVGIESAGHEKDQSGWPIHLQAGYNRVHELGLGCEAHGGEGIGVEHMMDVVKSLPITRLAHGFQVIEDLNAIDEIRKRNLILVMMPFVNLALGAHIHGRIESDGVIYPLKKSSGGQKINIQLHQHPFFELLRNYDIRICIGSDNPDLVGKHVKDSIAVLAKLSDNYDYSGDFDPLTCEELYECCINGINGAFCKKDIKDEYLQQLNEWSKKYNVGRRSGVEC